VSAAPARTRGGWVAVILWLVLQVTLTSLPGKDIPVSLPHPLDWVGHFVIYAGLGFLLARVAVLRQWPRRWVVWTAVALSAWAGLDELHQLFIPGRDAEIGDWIADTLGASTGIVLGLQLMASRFAQWLR